MYKLPKNNKKNKVIYSLNKKDRNKIKKEITERVKNEALESAFIYMLAIPAMLIKDNFSQFIKLEDEDGRSRVERFVDKCIFQYECIQSDHVTLEDMIDYLKEEAGIDMLNKM